MKNMKISMKLTVSYAVILVLAVLVGVAGMYGMRTINAADDDLYNENVVALSAMGPIMELFQLQRVHFRDYVIYAGNREKINEIKKLMTESEQELEELFALYETTIKDRADETAYYSALNVYRGDFAKLKNDIYEASLIGFDEGYAALRSPAAVSTFETLNECFDKCMADNERWAKEHVDDNTSLYKSMLTLSIILLAIAVLAALFFIAYLNKLISKPIGRLADAANNIARGNLNVNVDIYSRDELGVLAAGFAEMTSAINTLLDEINSVGDQVQKDGDIEAKINSAQYEGAYRVVADGINGLTQGIIGEVLMFFDCLFKFIDGDFSADIPQLPGKKIVMNNVLNDLRKNLKSISGDINGLVNSAIDGDLSGRVDTGGYKGDWVTLMNAVNRLMEVIATPIREAAEVLGEVSRGEFDSKMKGDYSGEFLVIKESINTTINNISSYISEISSVLSKLADDDLDQDITREYVGSFGAIKNAILRILDQFNKVISGIASASDQVASGAKLVSDSSMTLATGATEQASSLEELNATIHTINENTVQNAENAKQAHTTSGTLQEYASKGNEDMNKMLVSMNEIKESSGKISKIIKVIEDIAFQTNLLALNAAVEAARAGDHGKGFAVVAEEVRNLAGRTSVSAKETAELIEEAIDRVSDGTKVATNTDEALKAIVSETTKIAELITGIAEASDEQADAINQVMVGINQITEVVQNNSATAEESASASEELASQSDVLREMISVFRLR